MAASLPAGITGPETFSMVTTGRDAQWIVVRGSRAQLCRASGSEIMATLNSFVGTAAPGVRNTRLTRATLEGLRVRLASLGRFSQASLDLIVNNELNRESLRALLWLLYVHGQPDEGTPGTRVWLPDGPLMVPGINTAPPDGESGVFCATMTAATPRPPSPTPTGGGQTPAPTTPTGGTPAPTTPAQTTPPGGTVNAGVGLGSVAVAAGGFAILAAFALTQTKEGKRAMRDAKASAKRGASVMRGRRR